MEIVDLGVLPAEQLIHDLLHGPQLRELASGHGVACFVLPAATGAKPFYDALIENSSEIDIFTSRHIAFIVFYGDRFSIQHPISDECSWRRYQLRLEGLSTSCNAVVTSDNVPTSKAYFNPTYTEHLLFDSDKIRRPEFRHSMTSCAAVLMEEFNLPNSNQTRLLFVDPESPSTFITVSLNNKDQVDSLFSDVLTPLSDAFRSLAKHHSILENFYSISNISKMPDILNLRIKALETYLKSMHPARTRTEQIQILHEKITSAQKEFEALSAHEVNQDRRTIYRRNKLRKAIDKKTNDLHSLSNSTTKPNVDKITDELDNLRNRLDKAQSCAAKLEPSAVMNAVNAAEASKNKLIESGWPESLLNTQSISAMEVVRFLESIGKIGFRLEKATQNLTSLNIEAQQMIEKKLNEVLEFAENELIFKQHLLPALKQYTVIPFVGAGMSIPCGFPSWTNFLQNEAKRQGEEIDKNVCALLASNKYEEAAQVLVDAIGSDAAMNGRLQLHFGQAPDTINVSNAPIRHLPSIFTGPLVTTNYDNVIERAYFDRQLQIEAGATIAAFNVAMRANNPTYLFKLHGRADIAQSRILTKKDYDNHYGTKENSTAFGFDHNKHIPSVLRALFSAKSIIFLGCSLAHDRTMFLLEDMMKNDQLPSVFALIGQEDNVIEQQRRLDMWGIKAIYYPKGRHDWIETFLAGVAHLLKQGV